MSDLNFTWNNAAKTTWVGIGHAKCICLAEGHRLPPFLISKVFPAHLAEKSVLMPSSRAVS